MRYRSNGSPLPSPSYPNRSEMSAGDASGGGPSSEAAGQGRAAFRAGRVLEEVGRHGEAAPGDEDGDADRAAGVFRFARDVADVDVAQAFTAADRGRGPKGGEGCRRGLGVFVIGMEAADMP